jgi:DNA-binding winged helix-turn-helix (wHTH) protein
VFHIDTIEKQHVIEIIPKAGYRLIAHLEPVNSHVSSSDEISNSGNKRSANRHWLQGYMPIVATIALV